MSKRNASHVLPAALRYLSENPLQISKGGVRLGYRDGQTLIVSTDLFHPADQGSGTGVVQLEREFKGDVELFLKVFGLEEVKDFRQVTRADVWELFRKGHFTLKCTIDQQSYRYHAFVHGNEGVFHFREENSDAMQQFPIYKFGTIVSFWNHAYSFHNNRHPSKSKDSHGICDYGKS